MFCFLCIIVHLRIELDNSVYDGAHSSIKIDEPPWIILLRIYLLAINYCWEKFLCFIPGDAAVIHEILQHGFAALDVIIQGSAVYPVFVTVQGKQRWLRIFHVDVKHAVFAYCMADLPAHILDA